MSKVFKFKDENGNFQTVNKSDLRKWVKALRSGEYEQCTGELENAKGFCCLGVACKVFIPAADQKLRSEPACAYDRENGRVAGTLIGSMPLLQPNAPDWLRGINAGFANRLRRKKPKIKDLHIEANDSLTDLNDRGVSFKQIAEVIVKVAEL